MNGNALWHIHTLQKIIFDRKYCNNLIIDLYWLHLPHGSKKMTDPVITDLNRHMAEQDAEQAKLSALDVSIDTAMHSDTSLLSEVIFEQLVNNESFQSMVANKLIAELFWPSGSSKVVSATYQVHAEIRKEVAKIMGLVFYEQDSHPCHV